MICAQVHTQCHKSYVALYVRCALSVLQKECRKVRGARYTLGARYRSENTVLYLHPCKTTDNLHWLYAGEVDPKARSVER